MSSRYLLSNTTTNDEEFCIEGIIIFDDLETFVDIKGSSVIVFNESSKSNAAIEKLEETRDVQIAFESALQGNAEEISVERLVKFYLNNS